MADKTEAWTRSHALDVIVDAVGVVSVQTDCLLGDALEMMANRAMVSGCTLAEIATAVVDGTVRFGN